MKELPDVLSKCPAKSYASYGKLTEKLPPIFHMSWMPFWLWWQWLLRKKLLCICRKAILQAPAQGTAVHTLCICPVCVQHAWSDTESKGMTSGLSDIIKVPIYYRLHCLKNPYDNLVV